MTVTAEWRPGSTPIATYTSSRTCRACDGTGLAAFGIDCERCGGTGNAAPGDVPRDPSVDERRRLAPTDAQIRTLHRLVCESDEREPAVMLASDALGRSDADRTTINAHIAALTALSARRAPTRVVPLRAYRQPLHRRRGFKRWLVRLTWWALRHPRPALRWAWDWVRYGVAQVRHQVASFNRHP